MTDEQILFARVFGLFLLGWLIVVVASVLYGHRGREGTYNRAMVIGGVSGFSAQVILPLVAVSYFHEAYGLQATGHFTLSALMAAGMFGSAIGALVQWLR